MPLVFRFSLYFIKHGNLALVNRHIGASELTLEKLLYVLLVTSSVFLVFKIATVLHVVHPRHNLFLWWSACSQAKTPATPQDTILGPISLQFAERGYSTHLIYSTSDEDCESGDVKTRQVGTGDRLSGKWVRESHLVKTVCRARIFLLTLWVEDICISTTLEIIAKRQTKMFFVSSILWKRIELRYYYYYYYYG